MWSPLDIFCLHALETWGGGGEFSLRFIEVLWLKALYVENDQVKNAKASFEPADLGDYTGSGTFLFLLKGRPPPPPPRPQPVNLVNLLFRFHGLASHVV